MTNVPDIQFTPQGLVIPTQQAVLEGVLADFDVAFGGNLNKNLETPQGQLASSLAAIISEKNNQLAWLVNNLDPDYSDGIMQDAIGKIYFVQRKGQVNSSAECVFTGLPGTIIPEGFIVKDSSENEWVVDNGMSILATGEVTAKLTAKGVYGARANSITQIPRSIIGLDRVTNPQDAIVGTAVESRNDFAERYRKSVAINSQGMPSAVYSNVASLKGVVDCYVVDNPKGENVQLGASRKVLAPHSVYVAVVGGNDQEIAETIWRFTGNGCDFTGNTTVTVKDNRYQEPKPSYEIKFQRPASLPVYFQVKVKRGADLNAEQIIKQSIIETFKNSRLKIGSTIYAMAYIADLVGVIGKEYLLEVKLGQARNQYADTLEVGIDQFPTISVENISVVLV